ncbi:MAG: pectin methylesterase [Lachnospiraceae bacterium]|nr:pectin methylesterase [Lachnospiraceae bacterium]
MTIHLEPGIYRGPVTIKRNNVTLMGPTEGTAMFTGDLAGSEILPDGQKRGSFRTQTVFVDADHFKAINITFENSAGPGETASQALAIYSDGDDMYFENCRFLGFQDTVFTAPLPPEELVSGGFRGPKEMAPRRPGRQCFIDCYIEGTVDFIFGGAVSYFKNCEIFSKLRPDDKVGYITAASTPKEQHYGYVFDECTFTGDAKPGSVYLGRPWRNFAHVAVLNSYLGEVIHPDHWHDWNKPDAHSTVKYFEFNNRGPGAATTLPDFARFLSEDEAREYVQDKVLSHPLPPTDNSLPKLR